MQNTLMQNDVREIQVGDTFAVLGWSDRKLFKVVRVINNNKFFAREVETECKDWQKGTLTPVLDKSGEWKLSDFDELFSRRKYWRNAGMKVNLCWGAKTGFYDPYF